MLARAYRVGRAPAAAWKVVWRGRRYSAVGPLNSGTVESHTLLSHLAEVWAYVTLAASGIITEEAAPIVGGFAAHEGHLGITRVILACALGTWSAGVGLYALGRWRGKWVRKRFKRAGRYVTRLIVFVRRRPWRSAFAVRFAFGARIVLPIACGP